MHSQELEREVKYVGVGGKYVTIRSNYIFGGKHLDVRCSDTYPLGSTLTNHVSDWPLSEIFSFLSDCASQRRVMCSSLYVCMYFPLKHYRDAWADFYDPYANRFFLFLQLITDAMLWKWKRKSTKYVKWGIVE